jgi:cyclase
MPRFSEQIHRLALRVPEPLNPDSSDLPWEVQFLTFLGAHSPADVAVWLPAERILIAGDLSFNQVTPLGVHGRIDGWVRALDHLIVLHPGIVIPGHGPLASASELRVLRDYLEELRSASELAVSNAAPLNAVIESLDLGPVADWLEPQRTRLNLAQAIREAEASRASRVD